MTNYTTETIDYFSDNTELQAFVAKPNNNKKNPIVLICHAWAGRDQFVEDTACKLAELGYVGIALDVYGKGVMGYSIDEKMDLMQPLLDDRNELQARLKAGLDEAMALDYTDSHKIVAIGYCFGGLCVLDLARMELDLQGVISVHGLFTQPDNLSGYSIHAKVLALHGHLDPMVTPDVVQDFMHELNEAHADWQINSYGKALHAFTNPEADDFENGTVFDPDVANRAWGAITQFLEQTV